LLTITLFIALILTIVVFQKNYKVKSVFRSESKVAWWISGLSLYMFHLSADQGQFLTGLIMEHGMSGLWLVWSGVLGAFVIPLVFAAYWHKLEFMTDNQFLLFRYPGKSGQFLHAFRALYVGGLVVALLLCFHLIGFSRVLAVFFNIHETSALFISGCILILYSFKDLFELKLKLDAFNALVFIVSLIIILFSVGNKMDGFEDFFKYFKLNPEKKSLLPNKGDYDAWFMFIVYVSVQWWSSNLFDGGGPEMARFTAVKDQKSAIFTGLLPIFISFIIGFLMIGHIVALLGIVKPVTNSEIQYVQSVFTIVPDSLQTIVFIGFFAMFITAADSLLNWGSSFLTIDIYKTHINKKAHSQNIRVVAFISMTIICFMSVLFSFYIESLQTLVKITFSIAAGVAPVYILRWVWFRINAWSQISAMLSSAIFTLIYPFFHNHLPLSNYPENESRIIVVTILTTLTWLLLTYFTKDNSEQVRKKMEEITSSLKTFRTNMLIAIGLGILVLSIQSLIWFLILNS
jgi:SSS family solute:Na+ symporter